VDLPAGYVVRPPTGADLEPAADVLIADQLEDVGDVVLDANFLRNRSWRNRV
jgi:hypothetical protein